MKPQCKTAADCLRELARVMDQFGIPALHVFRQKYAKINGYVYPDLGMIPDFLKPSEYEFAIGEVEGKPVFFGDELWSINSNYKFTVRNNLVAWNFCTWNPPKPATIMVEMRREVAEEASGWGDYMGWLHGEIGNSCKKALEKV